jgi:hypothetical protein
VPDREPDIGFQSLYSEDWTRVFLRLARDAFGQMADAHALMEDARQRLAMSLSRLGAAGDSRELSRAYIFVAFKRALVDAYRDLFGRPKPRKWLSDLGVIGERLFELLCVKRLSAPEIVATVHRDPSSFGGASVNEAQVREILQEMERRRECASRTGEHVSLHDVRGNGQPAVDPIVENSDPGASAARDQSLQLRRMLFGPPPESLPAALRERLAKLQERGDRSLILDDEEYFILRCFRDQVPERRVGELLGGLTVRQVRYRRQHALGKLRRFFAEADLSFDDLVD